jgi:6-phosphogluconolactonase
MGSDGHTASIFPGPDFQAALDAPKARRAIGVLPDPLPAEAEVARVTLTRAAILSARTVMIVITGNEKRELLEQAIADGHSSKLPIGRVLAEAEQPIDVHWCP